ncbi:MAG: glycoside hydrolase family 9 protein [Cytophagaceae bacterium]
MIKKLSFCSIIFLLFIFPVYSQQLGSVNINIKVDQFGYQCNRQKVAVLANPQTGYNSAVTFVPGSTYHVRRWSDNQIMFTGSPVIWNSGNTDGPSGDKLWWFDFTSFNTPGEYYIHDPLNNARSYKFVIQDNVYKDVLREAVRTYYFQRCGVAKTTPHVHTGWADAVCHTKSLQDNNCRAYVNSGSGTAATEKNLSGGWHDAGDYNKYINFSYRAVQDLLLAYEENPSVWTDDFGIPESGNGVPDILDEVKVELDWVLKMQQATGNGSVLCMVGVRPSSGAASPPSSDAGQRFYGPATTSATLSAAAMLALGAIQFRSIGNTVYANTLQTAAVSAWNWAKNNTNITWQNTGKLSAGEQELPINLNDPSVYQRYLTERKIAAAAFLYALTGTAEFKTYFESTYTSISWYANYFLNANDGSVQDAMLYYTKASGITASHGNNIRNRYLSEVKKTGTFGFHYEKYINKADGYRSYLKDIFWGSNEYMGREAQIFLNVIKYNMDNLTFRSNCLDAASGYVHYIHGVNPTSFCYISNMSSFGAENSLNEIYSAWFVHGSAKWDRVGVSTYGPPPGYVPVGPNPQYSVSTVSPPYGQPAKKSYKDWNTGWPENSWEVTENAIYVNATYIRMLSNFVSGTCMPPVTHAYQMQENLFESRVFPNPADEKLFLYPGQDFKTGYNVQIADALGTVVITFEDINQEYLEVNVSHLAKGIYFVTFVNSEKSATVKFICR